MTSRHFKSSLLAFLYALRLPVANLRSLMYEEDVFVEDSSLKCFQGFFALKMIHNDVDQRFHTAKMENGYIVFVQGGTAKFCSVWLSKILLFFCMQ